MFKNYVINALRNTSKNLFYVGVNILGLAIALAVCITAFFNNKWDWDFDKFHENYADIYKVNVTQEIQGRQQEYGICPMPLSDAIRNEISAVNEVVDYSETWSPVKKGEEIFNKEIGYASSNFTDVFTLRMLGGDRGAIRDRSSILISVGLAEDFYLYGMWSPVRPVAFRLAQREDYRRFAVLTQPGETEKVYDVLGSGWKETIPNYPYNARYQVDLMQEAKDVNRHIKEIFIFLAIVASLLSAAGLYSLVSLRVLSKTKEIGVRKVLGATVPLVMKVISKPYLYIVGIAIVIGLAAGYFNSMLLMDSLWSQHIDANFLAFAIPLLLILAVAAATVLWKIYRAATQNPARSLRYE